MWKRRKNIPPSEFLEARLPLLHFILPLCQIVMESEMHNTQVCLNWVLCATSGLSLTKSPQHGRREPVVCRNIKGSAVEPQEHFWLKHCYCRWRQSVNVSCILSYRECLWDISHDVSPPPNKDHPSLLFLSAQAGEDLVPEQKDEREETETRDASVLHSIPPVLTRDGGKWTRCHFKVKHKLR